MPLGSWELLSALFKDHRATLEDLLDEIHHQRAIQHQGGVAAPWKKAVQVPRTQCSLSRALKRLCRKQRASIVDREEASPPAAGPKPPVIPATASFRGRTSLTSPAALTGNHAASFSLKHTESYLMRTIGTNANSSMSGITQRNLSSSNEEGGNLAGGGDLMNLMGAMAGLMHQGEITATATGSYIAAGSAAGAAEDAMTTLDSNSMSVSSQGTAEALKARREAMGRRASAGETQDSIRLFGDADDVQLVRSR